MLRCLAPLVLVGASIAHADPPRSAAVPHVFNQTEAEAEATLRRAGFPKVRFVRGTACGSVAKGVVIEKGRVCQQSPAAGRHAARALPVVIRIQQEDPWRGETREGQAWFLMPELVGWTAETAREKLAERGHGGAVQMRHDASCKPDVVCRQYPPGLQRATAASGTTLVVGPPR